jgi:hypothetical protein
MEENDADRKKIADIPGISKYASMMPLIELALSAPEVLARFGIAPADICKIESLARQVKEQSIILTLPDEFNEQFASQGWVATASLSPDTMRAALAHAQRGDTDAAEAEILSWFTEENIRIFAITRATRFNKIWNRYHQTVEALKLYSEERYIAAVPLILIICDGFASDLLNKSPFAEGADLSCLDSITGHSTSLPTLIELITKSVRKSSDDKLSLPLRHGILHGRSANYGSKEVCCKAWMLLIALVDWAHDKAGEERRLERYEAEQNETLLSSFAQLLEIQKDRRSLDSWTPIILQGPFTGAFEVGSPGEAFEKFFRGWKTRNYGLMAEHAVNLAALSPKRMAGELRLMSEFVDLLDFEFVKVDQVNPVRADATVAVRANRTKGEVRGQIEVFALLYSPSGDVASPSQPEGIWRVQQNCIYKVMHMETVADGQPNGSS